MFIESLLKAVIERFI